MPKVILGDGLIDPLDRIDRVLDELSPVQQQQVIEMLITTHLYRFGSTHASKNVVLQAMCKHVWQLLEQAEKKPPVWGT